MIDFYEEVDNLLQYDIDFFEIEDKVALDLNARLRKCNQKFTYEPQIFYCTQSNNYKWVCLAENQNDGDSEEGLMDRVVYKDVEEADNIEEVAEWQELPEDCHDSLTAKIQVLVTIINPYDYQSSRMKSNGPE